MSEVDPVDAARRPRRDPVFSAVHRGSGRVRDDPTVSPAARRGLDGQTIADAKETAERLRTEADYRRDRDEEDAVFDMPNRRFTGSVPVAFGMDGVGIYADMPAYGPFDKSAGLIDPQSS